MERIFTFGKTEYKETKLLKLPCWIGNNKFFIKTVMVEGDIPWLIGRENMEKMEMEIKLKEKVAIIRDLGGISVIIKQDSGGHIKIPLGRKLAKEHVWINLGENKRKLSRRLRGYIFNLDILVTKN